MSGVSQTSQNRSTLRILTALVAAIGLGDLIGGMAHAADQEAGRAIATEGGSQGAPACVTCHGVDGGGNAAAGFPRLAGLDAEYMRRQLLAYQDGTRDNSVMAPIAAALTEAEATDVSAYFAALPVPAVPAPDVEAALLEEGERLATIGNWNKHLPACVQCHGPGGRGVDARFPAIAGQPAGYIAGQLRAWQGGQRRNDPGQLMQVVAERMSDREVEAAAAYFASQSPLREDTP